jgi:hypothetical protein
VTKAASLQPSQGRDELGRFSGRCRTRSRVGTSRIGRRGPSHLANKDHLSLVRILVALDHMVGRLQAELGDREWQDPQPVARSNMRGLERDRGSDRAKRMRAVERAVIYFAGKRNDPDRAEFLKRTAKEYGKSFGDRTLYREPYVSVWAPHLSRPDAPQDASPLMSRYKRLARRALIQRILKQQDVLKDVGVDVTDALLAGDDGEDWSPLTG